MAKTSNRAPGVGVFRAANAPVIDQKEPVNRNRIISHDGGGLFDQAARRVPQQISVNGQFIGQGALPNQAVAIRGTAGPTVKFLKPVT